MRWPGRAHGGESDLPEIETEFSLLDLHPDYLTAYRAIRHMARRACGALPTLEKGMNCVPNCL
jgi:hypothetical protein